MPYSTPEMVRKAFVPSSDGTLPAEQTFTPADMSDDQLLDAIGEADGTIDSLIGRFFTTPVEHTAETAPHPIDWWSRNLAAYNAYLAFRQGQDFSDQDPVARRYQATMAALQAVNSGTASLELPRQGGDSRAAGASPAYEPYAGDLWTPEDFSIGSALNVGWGSSPFWRS
jgi:phage gp36-like protein